MDKLEYNALLNEPDVKILLQKISDMIDNGIFTDSDACTTIPKAKQFVTCDATYFANLESIDDNTFYAIVE